jgi:hypothetical protein
VTILSALLVVILGTSLAVGSAAAGVVIAGVFGARRNGPWLTNPAVGSQVANLYLRSGVAIGGLLALPASETVYASARRDSNGERLRGNCTYRVEGKALDAYWWSITAYGSDGYLIPGVDRWSYSMTELSTDDDGSFTIHVSRTAHTGAWIPLGRGARFTLALRLYLPGRPCRVPATATRICHAS